VADSSFPSKRLTYLLEIIADEAIVGNDAIFVRELGYSIREIRVLRIVDDSPGITFVEIWEKSGLERSLTSRILQKLIGDGLLSRTSSGTDARKYHLSTTEKGRDLRQRGRIMSDVLEDLLLRPRGGAGAAVRPDRTAGALGQVRGIPRGAGGFRPAPACQGGLSGAGAGSGRGDLRSGYRPIPCFESGGG